MHRRRTLRVSCEIRSFGPRRKIVVISSVRVVVGEFVVMYPVQQQHRPRNLVDVRHLLRSHDAG
jgi:hypothetical protein